MLSLIKRVLKPFAPSQPDLNVRKGELMYLGDALAFLAPPGKPPKADPLLKLDLAHVTSAPPWITATDKILEAHGLFKEVVLAQSNLHIVLGKDDLKRGDGTGIIFGLQSPPHDADRAAIKRLYDAGIRVTQVAYQDNNHFGGGFLEPETRLTQRGESFLLDCGAQGMIIDLSHAGHETARGVLAFSKENAVANLHVFASHTGCFRVYRAFEGPQVPAAAAYRNLPDDVLRGIADTGGIVGIYTLTFGLHPRKNDLVPLTQHIAHAIALCGEDAVAIGSDGVYAEQSYAELEKQFGLLKVKLDPDGRIGSRFPDQPQELNSPTRMEMLAERITQLTSPSVAEKVIGGNLRRFVSESI